MIRSVALQNFQSHKDTLLALHPGINAIVGDSDKGKTSILRGILWAITNRPNGLFLVSDWIQTEKGAIKAGEQTAVKIITDRGSPIGITRARRSDYNGYKTLQGDLEAIRTDVPPEVAEYFNMNEVNIQRQMDPPFLISYTAGEASRFINRLIKLEEIDHCLQKAESKRRSTSGEIRDLEAHIQEADQELDELDWTERLADKVAQAEETEAEMVSLGAEVARTQSTLNRFNQAQAQIREIEMPMVLALEHVTEARKTQTDLSAISRAVNRSRPQVETFVQTQVKHNKASHFLEEASPVAERLKGTVQEVSELQQRIKGVASSLMRWGKVQAQIKVDAEVTRAAEILGATSGIQKRITNISGAIQGLQGQIVKYQQLGQTIIDNTVLGDKLKAELPDLCPTCGKPMEKEHA